MRLRRIVLGAVLAVTPVLGAIGCSDDDNNSVDAAVTIDARPTTVDAAVASDAATGDARVADAGAADAP
jgi:hypothetical protein